LSVSWENQTVKITETKFNLKYLLRVMLFCFWFSLFTYHPFVA